MDMHIAFILKPPPGAVSDILNIFKLAGVQKIVFNILKRSLNFALIM
jgi:hypothetical protein